MAGYRLPEDKMAEIETAYITGSESYAQLAKRFGVSVRYVSQVGAKEDWVGKRRKYREDIVAKSVSKRAAKEVNKLSKLMRAADKSAEIIEKLFADEHTFNRFLVSTTDENGATIIKEQIFKKTDMAAFRGAIGAMKDLTSIIRDLYRLPTLREELAHDLAVQKFELAKDKTNPQPSDTHIVVTFEGMDDLVEQTST